MWSWSKAKVRLSSIVVIYYINIDARIWAHPAVFFNLLIYTLLKFIFNIFSLSCPIPAGAFAPVFVLGAGFGRTYGYILKNVGIYLGYNLVKCNCSIIIIINI